MRVAFIWHWRKKTLPELRGAFAAWDTLLSAIRRMRLEGVDAVVFTTTVEPSMEGRTFSEAQGIPYYFCRDVPGLVAAVVGFSPDFIMLNHHPQPYDELIDGVSSLAAQKAIYFSSPVATASPKLKMYDRIFVHHEYQRTQLETLGYDGLKVSIAPKTADMDAYNVMEDEPKQWDCIYPARGGFGYWKRLELAVEACALAKATLLAPGASIPGTLDRPARRSFPWLVRSNVGRAYALAKKMPLLDPFRWVTTLGWQDSHQMAVRYNQSRCLLITSNDIEMGPRVIPEAAACNLPVVVCGDSRACSSHALRIGGYVAEPNAQDIASKIRLALNSTPESRQRLIAEGLDTWVIYNALQRWFAGHPA